MIKVRLNLGAYGKPSSIDRMARNGNAAKMMQLREGSADPLHHKNAFSTLYQTAGLQPPKLNSSSLPRCRCSSGTGTRGNARSESPIE
jgi:hypothetical protein